MPFARLALALAFVMTACGQDRGTQSALPEAPVVEKPVVAEPFFRSILGEYDIFEAGPLGGPFRPFEGYVGTVEIFEGEVGLTFPYCPPNEGCLPGYAYFLLSSVKATQESATVRFSAKLDDGSVGRFRWTDDGTQLVFVNEQLEHSDGSKKIIEYHLRKR